MLRCVGHPVFFGLRNDGNIPVFFCRFSPLAEQPLLVTLPSSLSSLSGSSLLQMHGPPKVLSVGCQCGLIEIDCVACDAIGGERCQSTSLGVFCCRTMPLQGVTNGLTLRCLSICPSGCPWTPPTLP